MQYNTVQPNMSSGSKQYDPENFFYQQLFSNREAHLKYIEEQLQKKISSANNTLPNTAAINNSNGCQIPTQRKEVLKMTIDIGNGKKGQINIFEGDDPKELATNFCH